MSRQSKSGDRLGLGGEPTKTVVANGNGPSLTQKNYGPDDAVVTTC
jgi:hypothetical protein